MQAARFPRRRILRRWQEDEAGAITVLALFLVMTVFVIAGLAVDMSQLIAARTQLQAAADMAGHAALYTRDTQGESAAKTAALQLVTSVMPPERYGTVMTAEDIQFGVWDHEAGRFTPDNGSRSAVLITTSRFAERENPVSAFLLQFIGFSAFDVRAQSVFTTFRPACFREGFVAEGVVDFQSNNDFHNGFCIHSNTHVALNQNNTFEAGTVVSMPDLDDLSMPSSGFRKNEGLEAALREGRYQMRLINDLSSLIADVGTYGTERTPAYITSPVPVILSGGKNMKIDPSQFMPGRIHVANCNGGGSIKVEKGTYKNVVLTSNCALDFGNDVALEDAVFATTSTAIRSMTASSGLRLGLDDGCAEGGGAQLLTLGGMDFAAKLEIFGSQLVARKDVKFAASANGVEGASIVAGGRIDGTSNMRMGFCGTGMSHVFEADYFRMGM